MGGVQGLPGQRPVGAPWVLLEPQFLFPGRGRSVRFLEVKTWALGFCSTQASGWGGHVSA